jgi:hypothetical protein
MSTTAVDLDLLEHGDLRLIGLMPRASNYTFLAEVADDERAARVIYKPREGEVPLWDFPEGTLCQREVAAYRIALELGWPQIPTTILRDGPHGEGSVQLFVEHDPEEHYFTLRDRRPEELRAVAAFDVVAGNGDRKAGHCLEGSDGKLWLVDHGLCFNGQPVPAPLLEDLRRVGAELRDGELREELEDLLSEPEIEAAADRAAALIGAARYPAPGPGRSEPWPPV